MAKDPISRANWFNAMKNCINGKNLNKVRLFKSNNLMGVSIINLFCS